MGTVPIQYQMVSHTVKELVLKHDREANLTIVFQLLSNMTMLPFKSFAGFYPSHVHKCFVQLFYAHVHLKFFVKIHRLVGFRPKQQSSV